MTWALFAVLTAFFESLKDLAAKRGLKRLNAYVIGWGILFYSGLTVFPLLIYYGLPAIDPKYFLVFAFTCTGLGVSMYLYIKAISLSDLSITVPMIMFTPLFMLVTAPVIIGEYPSVSGFVGIVLIVFGSYVLNISERKHGFFAPFRALIREPGPKLMLVVAATWSVTATFDRYGIEFSAPIFWMGTLQIGMAILMLPFFRMKHPTVVADTLRGWKYVAPVGIAQGLMSMCHISAVELGLIPYVVAIKRMSVLMTVAFGALLFKEQGLRARLTGAAIMLVGALCIVIGP